MNIVISAHFDLARPIMSMNLDEGKLNGLVDNYAGVFVAYQTHRKTHTPVYLTNYEELEFDGAINVAKNLDKQTIVIVVDTIKESDISGKRASITNIYGLESSKLKEELQDKVHFIDGLFEETEDETWIYGNKYGLKTLYFGVPIPGDYHSTDNSIQLKTIDEVTDILVEVIQILSSHQRQV